MPEVILSLNASKYNSDLSASMELTEAKAKETADAVARSAQSAGNAGSKAAKNISAEGQKSGKSLKEAFSKWKESFTAGAAFYKMAGPLAAVDLVKKGIEICIELAKHLWDSWTQSAEEQAAIAEAQLKLLEKERAAMEQSHKETDTYLDRLKELGSQESMSNAERMEAARILDILNGKYKNLNMSIDDVTNSLAGFDEAQELILKAKAKEKLEMLNKEFRILNAKYMAAANLAFENMGNRFETTVMKWTGSKDLVTDMLINKNKQFTDQEHLDFLRELLARATNDTEIKSLTNLIEIAQRRTDIKTEMGSLKTTGYSSEAEAMAAKAAKNKRNADIRRDLNARDQRVSDALAGKNEKEFLETATDAQKLEYWRGKSEKLKPKVEKATTDRAAAEEKLKWEEYDENTSEAKLLDLRTKATNAKEEELRLLQEQARITAEIRSLEAKAAADAQKKADEEKAAAEAKKKQQQSARQGLLNKAQTLSDKYLSPAEAAYQSTLRDFESKKGESATEEERELIRQLASLTTAVNNKPQSEKIAEIQTNALTARGGFQTGAVLGDKDALQRQIEKNTQREANQSEEIKNLVKKITDLMEA